MERNRSNIISLRIFQQIKSIQKLLVGLFYIPILKFYQQSHHHKFPQKILIVKQPHNVIKLNYVVHMMKLVYVNMVKNVNLLMDIMKYVR